jgi:hypothetical protein
MYWFRVGKMQKKQYRGLSRFGTFYGEKHNMGKLKNRPSRTVVRKFNLVNYYRFAFGASALKCEKPFRNLKRKGSPKQFLEVLVRFSIRLSQCRINGGTRGTVVPGPGCRGARIQAKCHTNCTEKRRF